MMIGVPQVIGMKPTLRSFFSSAPPCANTSVAAPSGKNWEIAASAVEAPTDFRKARRVLRKHRPHHRGRDHALVALVLARWGLDGYALQRGVAVVLELADMPAAGATGTGQTTSRIKRIVEHVHVLHR
jgi:hypothetical protein